jgi:hypothetical protein
LLNSMFRGWRVFLNSPTINADNLTSKTKMIHLGDSSTTIGRSVSYHRIFEKSEFSFPTMHTNMAKVFFLYRKVQCAMKVITTHQLEA